jgi:hypothetical protein
MIDLGLLVKTSTTAIMRLRMSGGKSCTLVSNLVHRWELRPSSAMASVQTLNSHNDCLWISFTAGTDCGIKIRTDLRFSRRHERRPSAETDG